jgi:3-mercaptopropionate dioxygenase
MTTSPDLQNLIPAVRDAVAAAGNWEQTAERVADVLRAHRETNDLAAADIATGGSRPLHVEPDGTFSIVAIVFAPGQLTRIHDHVTWCVFAVIDGVEQEQLYKLDGDRLVATTTEVNAAGTVSGFAPPGDIHRLGNPGAEPAVSLHIYGTDVSRIGTSVRRYY